jgi:hypothetical protein
VQELANRIIVSEEANRLSNDIGALIQAKNSLILTKETWKLVPPSWTFAMSSTQIEDANRLVLSGKTEVKQALLTVNVMRFWEALKVLAMRTPSMISELVFSVTDMYLISA